jgi:hypothetical protein
MFLWDTENTSFHIGFMMQKFKLTQLVKKFPTSRYKIISTSRQKRRPYLIKLL